VSVYGLILGLAITLAGLIAVVALIQAVRDVEIAKATGLDPRNDTAAARDAAAKVRKTGPAGND
jgi:hypothetical protein